MLLKIDRSKAFDKLIWIYIQKILAAFGYSPPWVRWVMNIVSSTFLSILVNGIPSRPFNPSGGIHQGDPLSTFLFVLMVEGLGCIINNAFQTQQLRGILVHDSPAITHQQFVDESMLFGHPSVQEELMFKSILDDYSEASGANINTAKSQIFFVTLPPLLNPL